MLSTNNLQNAIDLVTKATEEDKKHNYIEALRLYEAGVESFLNAIKYEAQGENARECIRIKCQQYLDRAEKLRKHLEADKKPKKDDLRGLGLPSNSEEKDQAKNKDDSDSDDDDYKTLRKRIQGVRITEKLQGKWSDVASLDLAKEALKKAVFLPLKFPQLYTGKRKPWKSILLFGHSGTGKSLLARTMAAETKNSTFFAVSSSDLVAKYLGESEKLVKCLFELARQHKPSIIFIDEIDTLCSPKSDSEAESVRRLKTEIFSQMNGIGKDMDGILVLGATNIPWALDLPVRRIFEKRIYTTLPEQKARMDMFKLYFDNTRNTLTEQELQLLASKTIGYSGADINIVVRDALIQPISKIESATHFKKVSGLSSSYPNTVVHDLLTPCLPHDPGAMKMTWTEVPSGKLAEPPVTLNDVLHCLSMTKPSTVNEDKDQMKKFMEDYGCEGGC